MTDERRPPLRRVSILRTMVFFAVVALAFLAFDPFFGIFRFFFRGVLFIGVLLFVGSYLWPLVRRILIARLRSRDR